MSCSSVFLSSSSSSNSENYDYKEGFSPQDALDIYNHRFYSQIDKDYDEYNDNITVGDEDPLLVDATNNFLKALRASFRTVEQPTTELLQKQPLIALALFVSVGLFLAYILGFIILDGCIESWNPAENGAVPYWDEEIHTISRRIH